MENKGIFIKICGITRLDDAVNAALAGADAIGFIFYRKSPRYISPENAKRICEEMRKRDILNTGVFVNEKMENVKKIAEYLKLDLVQLHGDENPDDFSPMRGKIIKTIKVREKTIPFEEMKRWNGLVFSFLLEGWRERPGVDSAIFPWEIAVDACRERRIIIAGGLNPQNVGEVVKLLKPFGVDVSSGVECSPGMKNPELIKEFVKNALGAIRGEK